MGRRRARDALGMEERQDGGNSHSGGQRKHKQRKLFIGCWLLFTGPGTNTEGTHLNTHTRAHSTHLLGFVHRVWETHL